MGYTAFQQKRYSEAVPYLRKAAEMGHPAAQALLGTCYTSGLAVVKNDAEAAKLFRKSAGLGNEPAEKTIV